MSIENMLESLKNITTIAEIDLLIKRDQDVLHSLKFKHQKLMNQHERMINEDKSLQEEVDQLNFLVEQAEKSRLSALDENVMSDLQRALEMMYLRKAALAKRKSGKDPLALLKLEYRINQEEAKMSASEEFLEIFRNRRAELEAGQN